MANRLLAASLTPNILRDKGIYATLLLAESPNTKIIVVGGGEDGLPLILGKVRFSKKFRYLHRNEYNTCFPPQQYRVSNVLGGVCQ